MGKCLSVEALLANSNTRPVVGGISFVPVEGGKGKVGKMFEVVCQVEEIPVNPDGAFQRRPRIVVTDEFGHLGTEHQIWAQQRRGCPRK